MKGAAPLFNGALYTVGGYRYYHSTLLLGCGYINLINRSDYFYLFNRLLFFINSDPITITLQYDTFWIHDFLINVYLVVA